MKKYTCLLLAILLSSPIFSQKKSDLSHFIDSLIQHEIRVEATKAVQANKSVGATFKPIIFINGIERDKDNLNVLTLDLVIDIDIWTGRSAVMRFGKNGEHGVIDIYTIRTQNQYAKPLSVRHFDNSSAILTE